MLHEDELLARIERRLLEIDYKRLLRRGALIAASAVTLGLMTGADAGFEEDAAAITDEQEYNRPLYSVPNPPSGGCMSNRRPG